LYQKSYVLNQVMRILKEVVIPELRTEKAREQAIAMVAVLKNLDSHTSDNHDWLEKENEEMARALLEIAYDIQKEPRLSLTSLHKWAEQLPRDVYRSQTAAAEDELSRWHLFNQLLCDLVCLLYAEQGKGDGLDEMRKKYLDWVRSLLRKQVNRQLEHIH
jgi:hypothetical protein